MAHTPPSSGHNHTGRIDRIDRLIDGAMQEVAELSWDKDASASRSSPVPPGVFARPSADAFPGYQVLKEIRAGGQAVVYLGVEEATERRVAIKAFRPSAIPTPKDRYRFEREVEALQDLVHPNIVRILHADANGPSPFIVMEYVPGWNLDEYFREHDLDIRATMRLFRTITLAIHAAHQKGVIHRDIKPTNIRVDPNNEPHILDFGLAKLDSSPAPEPTMTETGQFLGTLHWVSPEQAEGRVQDVDVRTDVYSLGVVLYHMLTGELPFERGGSMRDVLNRIATVEPVPPSRRRREIDADADTIVLKCLLKDPSRRYPSAADLADDVERWLDGRPIEARRDSTLYVLRKTLKRQRVAAGVAAASVVLILGATVVSVVLWQRAARRAAEAERIAGFLSRTLTSTEEATTPSERTIMKRMMDGAAERIVSGELDDAPEAEMRVRLSIGNGYFFIGEYERARELFASAEDLARKIYGPDDEWVASAMRAVGDALCYSGRAAEALPKHEGALAIMRRQPGPPGTLAAEVQTKLAECLLRLERPQDALTHASQAVDVCKRTGLGDRLTTARAITRVGHAQLDLDRAADALTTYREVLVMCKRKQLGRFDGADFVAQTEGNVGKAFMAMDNNEEALSPLQNGLDGWRKIYAEDHPFLVPARRLLACCLQALGRPADAVRLYDEALAACRALSPGPHASTAAYGASLAEALRTSAQFHDAVAFAKEAAAMARAHPEWDDPSVRIGCEWALARALATSGDMDAAVESARQYADEASGSSPGADVESVWRRAILAEVLQQRLATGDAEASGLLARECVTLCEEAASQGRAPLYLGLRAMGLLGEAMAAQQKFQEAQVLLLDSRTGFTNARRTKAQLHLGVDLQREAVERLVRFYERWHAAEPGGGFDVEAARWRGQLEPAR